ncbi:hypothetical protein FNH22_09290 [Fulvivirga sp. M361]|uniref:hypothetical protein n=1 Tax=Fulvivirga sp. M361 TaxID=2594266 RepID=UPI00117BC561|nr:hypothetical protein [Fulvivirga sp. M361]TRX60231.1 hypothetical protein FNH22_09290 [Fulvivirga sp. M361]
MSGNTFNAERFSLLFKQHFIHNNKLLLYSTVAYCGVVFLILSLTQMGNNLQPHDTENFIGFLFGFVGVFGILYVGHSFPAFRSKENSINYLMVPGSAFEKFLFELVIRIVIMLILLPLLYWVTFHLQGYFFALFTDHTFISLDIFNWVRAETHEINNTFWLPALIISAIILGFVLPFTGAAMFSKQPLVKTLFSVAVIVLLYTSVIYIVVEHLGLSNYRPGDAMWLIPNSDHSAIRFFACVLMLANLVMLFVAYRKLKEKEV